MSNTYRDNTVLEARASLFTFTNFYIGFLLVISYVGYILSIVMNDHYSSIEDTQPVDNTTTSNDIDYY